MDDSFLLQLNCGAPEKSQLGCYDEEADLPRPLAFDTLENTIKSLCALWAKDGFEYSLPKSSYRFTHPLVAVLFFLLDRRTLRPPLDVAIPCLPLHELCQLSLLWSLADQEEAGYRLALKILPLYSFPSLWCPENYFNEPEVRFSTALLQRSFGIDAPLPRASNPFLMKLSQHLPSWKEQNAAPFRANCWKSNSTQSVEILEGKGVSLGAIRSGEIEIRSIGPQIGPLNDSGMFGIVRSEKMGQWAFLAADPSVWMRIQSREDAFSLSFMGVTPEKNVSLCFYVVADQAKIGDERFQSKSLRRYQGKPQATAFKKGENSLTLACDSLGKMELIPLAGEGCFWNAEFLLAFEVPCFEGDLELRFF